MNRDETTAAGLQDPVLDSALRRIVERFRPLRIILFWLAGGTLKGCGKGEGGVPSW